MQAVQIYKHRGLEILKYESVLGPEPVEQEKVLPTLI